MQTPKGYVSDELIAIIQNEEIATAMSKAQNPEECYDIVKDRVDVTLEEFIEQMTIIKTYIEEKKSGLLSEEDLDAIAGGKGSGQAMSAGTIVGMSAAGSIAIGGIAAFAAAAAG